MVTTVFSGVCSHLIYLYPTAVTPRVWVIPESCICTLLFIFQVCSSPVHTGGLEFTCCYIFARDTLTHLCVSLLESSAQHLATIHPSGNITIVLVTHTLHWTSSPMNASECLSYHVASSTPCPWHTQAIVFPTNSFHGRRCLVKSQCVKSIHFPFQSEIIYSFEKASSVLVCSS